MCTSYLTPRAHPRMLSRSQAFAAAFSAKKALLNVNATVNAKRTFTFTSAMHPATGVSLYRVVAAELVRCAAAESYRNSNTPEWSDYYRW